MPLTSSSPPAEKDAIHQFWQQRAIDHSDSPAATTDDICLRLLEAKTVREILPDLLPSGAATVLDVGCGDGRLIDALAPQFSSATFTGIDFSEAMIDNARNQCSRHGNATFLTGNALQLASPDLTGRFDVAMTSRCLINLPDLESQQRAIQQIASCLSPHGHYLAIENFMEGHDAMNAARRAIGLKEIPVRWHNRYFTEPEFLDAIAPEFELVELRDFSSAYYYATRVIYSKLCQMQGVEPDYDHDLHHLAIDLPPVGGFSPVRLAILRRRTDKDRAHDD